jgi:hypothetical protein
MKHNISLLAYLSLCAATAVPVTAHADFGYAELESLIKRLDAKRWEDVLPHLPSDLRSYYALMYDSPSLQSAEPMNPRVILYGNDGRLLIAFNGAPHQKNFASVEVTEFHPESARFEYRSIRFPEDRRSGRSASFSEANPKVCLTCHRADPRPNWSEYGGWPGAYGSIRSELISEYGETTAKEQRWYGQFLQGNARKGRYQFLTPPQGLKFSPYNSEFDEQYPEKDSEGGIIYPPAKFLTNFRLGDLIAKHNAARVLRLMTRSRLYSKYFNLLLYQYIPCTLYDSDTPLWGFTNAEKARLKAILVEDSLTGAPYYEAVIRGAFTDYLVQEVFGLDAKEFNMTFGDSSFGVRSADFFAGFYIQNYLIGKLMYESAMKDDGILRENYITGTASVEDPDAMDLFLNGLDHIQIIDRKFRVRPEPARACTHLAEKLRKQFGLEK